MKTEVNADKAMPTARYDERCQAAIEAAQGIQEMPTL